MAGARAGSVTHMARTKTRPAASRASRPRGGGVRPRVGRRRTGPTYLDQIVAWLLRVETAGMALVVAAALSIVWLGGFASSPRFVTVLVEGIGLHAFTLSGLLAAVGVAVWSRQLSLVAGYPRLLGAAIPLLAFEAGLFGLLRPDLTVGGASLADVTAGGDLGEMLMGSPLGVVIWLGMAFAAVLIVSPQLVLAGLERVPGLLSAVWGWRIPHKLWHGLMAVIDFAFPTKPPPDERALQTAPAWLPGQFEEGELGRGAVATVPPEQLQEPEIPANRLRQGNLPMYYDPDEEEEEDEEPVPASTATAWLLPPMDLLVSAAPVDETVRPDNALRAGLIVETLASFGVDARVSQFHEGPVVTQFDVEPGWEIKTKLGPERDKDGKPVLGKDGKPVMRQEEVSRTRVRVNQITSLSNDLALALAAPSLRIEAPVPGRSVVGIEVPNTSASVVTMRSVIETPAFQRLAAKSKLALPLGKSVSGEPVVADLTKMPHLLIAGATGSGKSVAINSIIASILMQCRPEEVRFVMIDPKRVELSGFAMIPHLAFSNIVVDMEKVVGTLGAVLHEMEARYKRFASLAVRNIESYNKHPKVAERMPFWVVIIDELADLMMAAPFEVERQICRLAQLARATGIHLIVATQRPSVDVVTGLIKANFPTRIAFAMTSQVDSRTILDMAGAERLLGRGDMLYMPTDASKPKRVQGVYLSDAEIDRIVAYWAQQRVTHSTPVYDHLLEEAQAAIEEEEDADPMYERAKALAEEHSRISTSMLQRRLRIGYPRAARMMDRLEEEGIVGSSSGGSREVLSDDDVDDDDDGGFRAPY